MSFDHTAQHLKVWSVVVFDTPDVLFLIAGINVTAFTKTMLEQRRLDTCLYDAIVKHAITGTPPEDKDINSQRNELVAAGFAAFNAIYGETWARCRRARVMLWVGATCHLVRSACGFNSQSPASAILR